MDGEPDDTEATDDRPQPPPQHFIVEVVHRFPEQLEVAMGLGIDVTALPPITVNGTVTVMLEEPQPVVGPPTHIALVPRMVRHN